MLLTRHVGLPVVIVFPLFQVFRTLVEITKDIGGAKVENHKFCTSVHYRNVDEKVSLSVHNSTSIYALLALVIA